MFIGDPEGISSNRKNSIIPVIDFKSRELPSISSER